MLLSKHIALFLKQTITFYMIQNFGKSKHQLYPDQVTRGVNLFLVWHHRLPCMPFTKTNSSQVKSSLWHQNRNTPTLLQTRSWSKWCLVFFKFLRQWKSVKKKKDKKCNLLGEGARMQFTQKYFGVSNTLMKQTLSGACTTQWNVYIKRFDFIQCKYNSGK